MLSDAQLLQQFLNGDEMAFAALVRRHERLLFSYARRFFGEREKAEDICQAVWLQFFLSRSLQPGKENETFKAWLMMVLHRRCIDEARKEKRRAELHFSCMGRVEEMVVESLADDQPLLDEAFEIREQRQWLAEAIDQLPPNSCAVLWLRTYWDLSYTEIAQILSCSPDLVRTRLHRARTQLFRMRDKSAKDHLLRVKKGREDVAEYTSEA